MTLPSILGTSYVRPLEREFESWTVREIEDYFLLLGQRVIVWAVSPTVEATWPADEAMVFAGKLIGLQFKQAQLGQGAIGYDRLKWSLRSPAGQYEMVRGQPEIFYALPTFINRRWARTSLQHCLFWRPPNGQPDYNAWYDNPGALTPHSRLSRHPETRRWGGLVEDVLRCTEGLRVEPNFNLRDYVAGLASYFGDERRPAAGIEAPTERSMPTFYLLNLPL